MLQKPKKLPLADNSIDFLFMNWVIYKCNAPITIKEILRVLKKDAYVMISYRTGPEGNFEYIRQTLEELFDVESRFKLDNVKTPQLIYTAEAIYGKRKL